MTRVRRLVVLFALLSLTLLPVILPGPAVAVQPSEVLQDPGLEGRARDISKHLRCLVCQNQSIDDSDADLAHDLRVLVRERLTAGDSRLATASMPIWPRCEWTQAADRKVTPISRKTENSSCQSVGSGEK